MTGDWVVLLEVERREGTGVLTLDHLDRLLTLLADHSPSGLWSSDRYGVQVVVPLATPDAALAAALSWWRQAVDELRLPAWRLVRAELKTPAELEAEHRSCVTRTGSGAGAGPSSDEALRAAYQATRRLLAARTRAEAAEVLATLAVTLGATLVADDADHARALPLDLSCGEGHEVQPAAEPLSIARLDLEEVLPAVMVDAARVLRLLDSAQPVAPSPSAELSGAVGEG
jgi:hypothetical protein